MVTLSNQKTRTMKIKLLYTLLGLVVITTSCQKDLNGNAITVDVTTNDTLIFLRFYERCDSGPDGMPSGSYSFFNNQGSGNYSISVEEGYQNNCFIVAGAIAANNDSTGKTVLNINAFYTNEGNVVGFKELELKRPHDEYQIRYEFQADTYLEN